MGNEWPMPSDERRSPDAHLFRELYSQLHDLSRHVERLTERMGEIAALTERAGNNSAEIKRLRDKVDVNSQVLARLDAPREPSLARDTNGGVYIKPGWLTLGIFMVGTALTGLWKVISWIIDLAKGQ